MQKKYSILGNIILMGAKLTKCKIERSNEDTLIQKKGDVSDE